MRRIGRAAGAVAAAMLLTACGGQPPETAEPVTTSGCMVSAPAGFADRSIGQLSFGEMSNARSAGFLASTSSQRVSTTDGTGEALSRFAAAGCDLGALVGPGGADALSAVAVDSPDTVWLAVATGGTDYPDNVVTIDFDLREPAFIAGYSAAARSETGTVAIFASRGFAAGDALLAAFDAGVEQRNADAGTAVEVLRAGSTERRTVDDTQAAGREYTEDALDAGADVIVPFASGAASGVLEVFTAYYGIADADAAPDPTAVPDPAADGAAGAAEGDAAEEEPPFTPTLVWYGTDGSQTLGGVLGDHVIASTVPNVAAGFQSTVAGWPETGFAGELGEPPGDERTIGDIAVRAPEYTGTMDNGGVEIVATDGLLSSVAGLGRDIAEVRERIAEGEVEVPGAD